MPWMQVLWATLAGAGVLFFWGFVCWVVLGHHFGDWNRLPAGEGEVEGAIVKASPPPGLYAVPHWDAYPQGQRDPGWRERMKRPPHAHLYVLRPNFESPATFVKGFLFQVLVAGTLALLLFGGWLCVAGVGPTMLAFAVVGALAHGLQGAHQAIWMTYPWRPVLTNLFDGVTGFALVGLVMHLLR